MTPSAGRSPSMGSIEDVVVAIWRDELADRDFGPYDRPFERGGTSLTLLKVHRRIELELGVSVPPVVLFEHPTAAALARHLHEHLSRGPAESPSTAQEELQRARDSLQELRRRTREVQAR